MWRTVLLGKLGISILASLVAGGICVSVPWRRDLEMTESYQWFWIGVFFLVLAVCQVAVIFVLTRKSLPDDSA